jgi:hypothetical protein
MNVLGRLALCAAAAAVTLTTAACSSSSNPAKSTDLSALPVVMTGTGGMGSYDVRAEGASTVIGTGPWGDYSMSWSPRHNGGTNLSGGTSTWGPVSLVWLPGQVNGYGNDASGAIKVMVTSGTQMSGVTEWGDFLLTLKGQTLSGALPIGSASFRLASQYNTLYDPRVMAAIMAVLSGKD